MQIQGGLVFGGDAEEGIAAFDDVDLFALHVGGGEDFIEVHFADDAAGDGRGRRGGKHIDDGGEFFAGFGEFAQREQFVGFLKRLFAGIDVGHFGGIEHFREVGIGLGCRRPSAGLGMIFSNTPPSGRTAT